MIPFVTVEINIFELKTSENSLKIAIASYKVKLNNTHCLKIHHTLVTKFSKIY